MIGVPLQAWQRDDVQAVGPRRGALIALYPLLSDVPRALVILIFLAQLPSWFLETSRLVGGVLLLQIIRRLISRAYRKRDRRARPATMNRSSSVPRSLALWMLDPALHVLWATVTGPLLLASWRQNPAWGFAFVASFYGSVLVGAVIFYLLAFSSHRHALLITRVICGLGLAAMLPMALLHIWRGGQALAGRLF